MSAYSSDLPKFAEQNAQVLGISNDSIYCHLSWQEKGIGYQEYPLASDYWPHGSVALKYGVLREGDPLPGICERAVFIVDKQGKIVFIRIYEIGQEPDNEECLQVLRGLPK
jgi:alkyl hydroperoxide reductase subunit AhpC